MPKKAASKNEASEPLRGHAAWKAEKDRIAERNEAAFARGRQERTARQAAVMEGRRAQEKRERASYPSQPQRPSSSMS
jgi:hypothetical protein